MSVINGPTKGRWDMSKRPSAYSYELRLECAMCPLCMTLVGECKVFEAGPVDIGAGSWRRLTFRGDHDDPIRQEDIVVCSRACAQKVYDREVERLYA